MFTVVVIFDVMVAMPRSDPGDNGPANVYDVSHDLNV